MSERCAICHSKQRLRADGTLGQHHLYIGDVYMGICPGTGKTSEETFAEADELRRIMAGRIATPARSPSRTERGQS